MIPLARTAPVLLLVMDGLSFAVFHELFDDFVRSGWVEIQPNGRAAATCGIAMLPTLTEVSRASLLHGAATRGAAHTERAGFSGHPGLLSVSSAGKTPLLFHKANLDTFDLSMRDVLGDPGSGSSAWCTTPWMTIWRAPSSFGPRWSVDDLQLMRPILHEARNAGRLIILTADHGHVLDHGTVRRAGEDGQRWRRPDGKLQPDEVELAQGRVLTPADERIAVLPWSEAVRYGAPKLGYHGGATPQEVVIPLAVLSAGVTVGGWSEAPPAVAPVVAPSGAPRKLRPAKTPSPQQPALFEAVDRRADQDWIAALPRRSI